MRKLAVINQKGGVGKTTTTANLGAALARGGLRVLLVDLDPQAHLTLHFGIDVGPERPTMYDILIDGTPVDEVAVPVGDRLTLLPSDIDLAAAETQLVSVTGREVILREALAGSRQSYDVLLIDCPPSLGVLTINALVAATEVLIPLQAHFFALQGLSKLLDTVTIVRQRINPQLRVTGIVLCMFESATKLAGEVVDDVTSFLAAARGSNRPWAEACIYQTAVRRNIKLAESSSYGQTVFNYAPRSNGAADYANLAAEAFGVSCAAILGEEPVTPAECRVISVRTLAESVTVVPPATRRLEPTLKDEPVEAELQAMPAVAQGPDASEMVWRRGVWIVYWLAIFTVTHTPKLPRTHSSIGPFDKLVHGVMFLGLTLLGGCAFGLLRRPKSVRLVVLWFVGYGIYGAVDEWTQQFVGRTPEVADWLADLCGVLVGSAILLLGRRSAPRPGSVG